MIRRAARAARTRKEDGATAVEFALVLPVLVTTIFFALYGGLYFYYGAMADHVARTVARQVSIPVGQTGSAYPDANAATVVADAKAAAGTLIPNPSTATATSLPATSSPEEGDMVTVTVTYKLPVLDLMPGFGGIDTITRSASERRQ
ncbi:MAG TPA: TadE/TadG family type IV pilus assembly protein [Mycobacteriales bacterium]|nr:TadE/TadG family type IV pilus assembly protein [Mycobacteriales bacterium]